MKKPIIKKTNPTKTSKAAAPKKSAAKAKTPKVKADLAGSGSAPPPQPKAKKSVREGRVIKFLVEGNPRKEGSLGAAHFEMMKKFPVVTEYLAQYEAGKPRKTASQWLWNSVNDKFVQVVKG